MSREFRLGGVRYSALKPLVIAEIGTAHGGERGRGYELIDAALEAGADCVKFQHVYADEIIHPKTGLVPLPGGPIPLYQRFRQLECGPDFLADMKERVESRGGHFLCTPFGLRSAGELAALGVQAFKIASPELNHLPLLDAVAGYGKPCILSSGVSRLADIEAALDRWTDPQPGHLALLHCVTAYPAPAEDYNLRVLPLLSGLFGLTVGVSDHSKEAELVPLLALSQGAVIVEKHICLSRQADGLDDPIALEPEAFAAMCGLLRRLAPAGSEASLREAEARFGGQRVAAVLGDGRKRLAASEAANYLRTNRSIHATRSIRRGEVLDHTKLALLRTEKVLRPGLSPALLPVVLGRQAGRDIEDGQGLEWADLW